MTDVSGTNPTAATLATTGTVRSESLDAARFVAAIGIVWLHTYIDDFDPRLANVGRFAVPFFAMTSVYLQSCGQQRNPTGEFSRFAFSRVRRLYLPFLFWTLVYYLTANAKRAVLSHQPLLLPGWGLLVAGSSLHLWFLPFLLAISIILFPAIVVTRMAPKWPTAIALAIAGALVGGLPSPWHGTAGLYELPHAINAVVGLGWAAIPAVCWGLALSLIRPCFTSGPAPLEHPFRRLRLRDPDNLIREAASGKHTRHALLENALPAGFCGVLMAAVTVWLVVVGRNILLENIAGAALFLAAMYTGNSPVVHRLAGFGRDAYGIYLIHVLFLEMLFAILPRLHIPNSYPLKFTETIVVSLISLGLVRLIRRSRLTAWTVD